MFSPFKHKKLSLGILLVALAAGGFFLFKKPGVTETFTTVTVKRQNLVRTVEATGVLESVDRVDLSFETGGTLVTLPVTVGQSITTGTVLGQLDDTSAQAEYQRALQAVDIAQANLSLKQAGASSEDVAVAEAQVATAKTDVRQAEVQLDEAKKDVALQQASSDAAVSLAQAKVSEQVTVLDNLVKTNTQSIAQADQDLLLLLGDGMTSVRKSLSAVDDVLGITNTLANDDFQTVLSITDAGALAQAETTYREALVTRNRAETSVYALPALPSLVTLEGVRDEVLASVRDALTTLYYTRRTLDATSVDTKEFSFEDLNALKSKIDTARVDTQSVYTKLVSQDQTRSSLRLQAQTQASQAENLLASLKQSLANAKADKLRSDEKTSSAALQAEVSLARATSRLKEAEAQLLKVKATPRFVDTAALVSAVNQAEADLTAVKVRLEKTVLRSPIDGVVTAVSYELGEQVAQNALAFTVQAVGGSYLQIKANVSEADIASVALKNSVDITFDAFGSDRVFKGEVTDIHPAENKVEGVVFYEVTVTVSQKEGAADGFDHLLRPGLSADITITTAKKDQVLVLPQRSVLEKDGKTIVRRVTSPTSYVEEPVSTGLRADQGLVEMLSGVTEGEEVVLSVKKK